MLKINTIEKLSHLSFDIKTFLKLYPWKNCKPSKSQFLASCQLIGLLEEDKQSWENFKKSKVKVDKNFINQKIIDRNKARKKGNYKLADILRKELEDNGVIIEDKQHKTTWKYK